MAMCNLGRIIFSPSNVDGAVAQQRCNTNIAHYIRWCTEIYKHVQEMYKIPCGCPALPRGAGAGSGPAPRGRGELPPHRILPFLYVFEYV